LKSFQDLVRPAWTSFIARSRLCSAISAEYAWWYVRARSRSIAFDFSGTFHSISISGNEAERGSAIWMLSPVAFA
jgi:hypothetical protein